MKIIFPSIPNRGASRWSHDLLAGLIMAASLMTGCGQHSGQETKTPVTAVRKNILASIGSSVITTEDFQQEVARRGRKPATDTERTQWLSEMVRLETLYANATADGFGRDPEVQLALKKMVAGKYLENHRT